jgi:hypothetical protein
LLRCDGVLLLLPVEQGNVGGPPDAVVVGESCSDLIGHGVAVVVVVDVFFCLG